MTFLVERLADLRKHLQHLEQIRPRVRSARHLEQDLTLHNDILFSLLRVVQALVDIAGELASRRGIPFSDYTEAVRSLRQSAGLEESLVEQLARLPGFRNVLIHEYVQLDYDRVVEAIRSLEPLEEFAKRISELEAGPEGQR